MNCQLCQHHRKDGYCEKLELYPCYPEKGCDYFNLRKIKKKDIMQILEAHQEICDKVKDLSERVENIENQMKKEKEERLEKLKAEIDYAKFSLHLMEKQTSEREGKE